MNIEIKFRAWETNKGLGSKMSEPFTLTDLHNRGLGTFGDNYEFMQFTGLKDKNGKDIYEGDIIKDGGWVRQVPPINEIILMAFDENSLGDFREGEVIGNIYQNPELLESVQK